MQKTTTVCDVCGKVKGESNHWWQVAWDLIGDLRQVAVCPADGHAWKCKWEGKFDVCGQECAVVKLSEFMNPPKPQQANRPNQITCEMYGCRLSFNHLGAHDIISSCCGGVGCNSCEPQGRG